jgi:hypothetical protein
MDYLNLIKINDTNMSDSRPCHHMGGVRTYSTEPDDNYKRRSYQFKALFTKERFSSTQNLNEIQALINQGVVIHLLKVD